MVVLNQNNDFVLHSVIFVCIDDQSLDLLVICEKVLGSIQAPF